MPREAFGERLRFAIDHSGLTVRQLATRAELPEVWLDEELTNVERLPMILMAGNLAKLCELLGVTWAWLVEGEPTPGGVAAARRFRNTAIGLTVQDADKICHLLEAIV